MGVAIFAPATFWERTDTLEEFEQDQSALGRVYAWHVASAVNLDHPLRGVGGGAFREAWAFYAPPEVREHALVAHNIFLDTLGELGWVGFFLFLAFAGSTTGAVFRAGRRSGDRLARPGHRGERGRLPPLQLLLRLARRAAPLRPLRAGGGGRAGRSPGGSARRPGRRRPVMAASWGGR